MNPIMLIDELRSHLSTFSEREDADPEVYPSKDIAELFSMGMLSAPFPKSVGGGGLSCEECISLIIELAAAAPSTALVACMPMGLAAGAGGRRGRRASSTTGPRHRICWSVWSPTSRSSVSTPRATRSEALLVRFLR